MVKFMGFIVILLSFLSWVNCIAMMQVLAYVFEAPVFSVIYFFINTLCTFILINVGLRLVER